MKKIIILGGVYGYRPDGLHVEPKEKGEACIVSDDEAERLAGLGVAAIERGEDESPIPLDAECGEPIPAYSTDMKSAELKALMERHGAHYKVGMTKADCVAALDAVFGVCAKLEEPVEAEQPPTFDAAEAVQ